MNVKPPMENGTRCLETAPQAIAFWRTWICQSRGDGRSCSAGLQPCILKTPQNTVWIDWIITIVPTLWIM